MKVLERLRAKLAFHEAEAAKWRTALALIADAMGPVDADEAEPPTPWTPALTRRMTRRSATGGLSIRAAILQTLEHGPAAYATILAAVTTLRADPTQRHSFQVELNRLVRDGILARGPGPIVHCQFSLPRDRARLTPAPSSLPPRKDAPDAID